MYKIPSGEGKTAGEVVSEIWENNSICHLIGKFEKLYRSQKSSAEFCTQQISTNT
jgi:hypothetical protein